MCIRLFDGTGLCSFTWIFLFSGKHCLPLLQFPYFTPFRGVQTGVIVNKGAISWLRQTSVDAVARLAANVLAGTVFQKMIIRKDLPLIKHVRLKRQLKQPNGLSFSFLLPQRQGKPPPLFIA